MGATYYTRTPLGQLLRRPNRQVKWGLDAMTTEQLDLATVDRVLSRLDRQMSDTRVSCVERLFFFGLTASVYAIPLLTGALLVGKTFASDTYGAPLGYLESLLVYSMIAAVLFVPLNFRLFAKTLAHQRMVRSHEDLRVADFLFGRRGRLEESTDARALVLHGIPGLLTAVLIVSVATGAWTGDGPGLWALAALAACIAFFFVQHRCRQLLDFLRRRVDFSREVLTVRRRLEQRRQRAADLKSPVTLSRNMALRLSDLDRMFVLTNDAAARVRAQRPGIAGATVTWDPVAVNEAAQMPRGDRPAIESAIQQLSVEIARHRKALLKRAELPARLDSTLAKTGLRLERDADNLRLEVQRDRSQTATVLMAADGPLETLVVKSVIAGRDGRQDGGGPPSGPEPAHGAH